MTFTFRAARPVAVGLVSVLAVLALIGSTMTPAAARRGPRVTTTYAGSWRVSFASDPQCAGGVGRTLETGAFTAGTFRGGSFQLDFCPSGTTAPFSISGTFTITARRASLVGTFVGSTDAWTFYRGVLTGPGGAKRYRNTVLGLEGTITPEVVPITARTSGTIKSW
jgi:hypothetical protein